MEIPAPLQVGFSRAESTTDAIPSDPPGECSGSFVRRLQQAEIDFLPADANVFQQMVTHNRKCAGSGPRCPAAAKISDTDSQQSEQNPLRPLELRFDR